MCIRFRVLLPLATYILMSLYGSVRVSMLSIMAKSQGSYYQSTEEPFVGIFLQKVVSSLGYRQVIEVTPAVAAP